VLKARADGLGIEAVVFAPQIGVSDPSGENLTGFLRARLAPSAGN
jgi:hypothetical protein